MCDPFVVRDVPAFRAANEARTLHAAVRAVARARAVLDSGTPLNQTERGVLSARVENPQLSLDELGGLLGITKDAYARRLARALETHERTRP
jgi:DNA-binding transcriptional regulator WhiA